MRTAPASPATLRAPNLLLGGILAWVLMLLVLPAYADDGRGTPFIVEKTDNICGLDEPKQLSDPAVVDYEELLAVTPQIKRMKREKIDPNSARGIQLRTEAEALIREKCEAVLDVKGHCSVWKKIERRDGGKITDLTSAVKKKITGS